MKLHLIKLMVTLSIFSSLLTGCWDSKELQEVYYIVGAGIDFDEKTEEYVLYVQMLDFGSITGEAGKPAEEIPPWVGESRGETVTMAAQNLYEEAQHQIFWGHISAIVLSENLLKKGIDSPIDAIIRHPESRYMPWIYGTDEPLADIFDVTSIFKLSPLQTIIHNPMDRYIQKSMIPPIQMNEFLRFYQEPGYAAFLPRIEITDEIFSEAKKSKELFRFNGAYILEDGIYRGMLNQEQLIGHRWLQEETVRTPILIRKEKEAIIDLTIIKPEYTIDFQEVNNEVFFTIDVSVGANIKDIKVTIRKEEMAKEIEKTIKDELRYTFLQGLKIDADVLHLRNEVYRKDVQLWKKQIRKNGFALKESMLKDINVEVNIIHTGKYQLHENQIYNEKFMRRINDD